MPSGVLFVDTVANGALVLRYETSRQGVPVARVVLEGEHKRTVGDGVHEQDAGRHPVRGHRRQRCACVLLRGRLGLLGRPVGKFRIVTQAHRWRRCRRTGRRTASCSWTPSPTVRLCSPSRTTRATGTPCRELSWAARSSRACGGGWLGGGGGVV